MSILSSRGARRLTLAALAALWAPAAFGADLFATPKEADFAAAAAARPKSTVVPAGVSRIRAVAVNADAVAEGKVASTLTIGLFPGVSADFKVSDVEPAANGGSVINAKVGKDGDEGDATLVVSKGKVTGRVRYKGRIYAIRPLGGVLHSVSEADRSKTPSAGPEIVAPLSGGVSLDKAKKGKKSKKDVPYDWTVAKVDVMFVYTAKAAAASADIGAEIDLAVAITNEAYRASGVRMTMRLVKTTQAGDYDEDAREDYNAPLYDITGNGADSASFADARRVRDEVGADFVVLLREGGGYCGVAWVITQAEGAGDWTFAQVSRGACVDADTVAHEVGHNMGLRHDRYVTKDENGAEFPSWQYNFGYVSLPARAMDLMAYENQCWDAGVACEYKRVFSSPRLWVNGRKFGVPAGRPGAADAARWLDEIRWIAQDVRPRGGTLGAKKKLKKTSKTASASAADE
ncbi:zinc-dependent metalloprotease family protein [Chenggangzhangella methanolivorans]|uniref:Peptidyl-Asp metalloendopeptidase n=1 Tax=Chenggangzhangella methanolivorans TaxID=1437009 RepID=A0A9E6UPK8_9HYPH|nr:zinc-dependent metalloprotease family protein [Chenggangzhangella methanolivorans]QZO01519.1 hypothetical protein K6K41_08870 [Chenggangzhangella methanolivorans]